jgi:hypothetical protein
MRLLLAFLGVCLFATTSFAAEKGIFDYEGQKTAGDKVKKIIFIADAGTHGPRGNHEFMACSPAR